MKKNKKKIPPKLPRFQAPKDMRSKIFSNKKQKENTRMKLKKIVKELEEIIDEDM